MIGIDTNILLRALQLSDDPVQTKRAQTAINVNAPVFLSDIVLIEFVWTCRRTYGLDRLEIHRRLEAIVEAPEFVFARPEAVARAVAGYGSRKSDFADWLIGETNLDNGCDATLTFDAGASKGPSFTAVP